MHHASLRGPPRPALETVREMPYAGRVPRTRLSPGVLWLVVEGLARDVHDDVALVEQVLADGEQARLGVRGLRSTPCACRRC